MSKHGSSNSNKNGSVIHITVNKYVIGILMGIVSVIWFIPIYFMIINSFKPFREVLMYTSRFPEKFNLNNFVEVWEKANYLKLFTNSIIITSISLLGIVILASMAAYKLARSHDNVSKGLLVYFILTLVIPFQAVMIPLVKIMKDINVIDTRIGIILVYIALGSPMAIFLYYGYIKTLPMSLEEAALIDGAGEFQIFFKIIFPLLKPITSTVIILQSLWIWNDFLLPLITLQSEANKTIPLGTTATFMGQYTHRWDLAITAMFLASLPLMVLYFFVQKYIVKGIVKGAIKG
ncbi:carbohydrate ABC transporter permease [Halothermothrix orenii]|uniref:Binding-protein-dependent transport systems inner membrane component n=1 Tax=Halothermothrix orenii (strain H 168 / OCM 544 / DSM 9562) TaxID=373903 RepID=B8CWN8_HALOH|nr:carbohydrate ABC transporter permease [Halothermothrix orenii]ACL69707.1 binding-protein-dependent transport systems inner membrane component [Halothermothrix orenii H 168]